MRLADILPTGRENAIPGHRLAELLELKDKRDVLQMAERERRAGAPICASNANPKGYYLASSPEEMAAYIQSLDHRISQVTLTRTHCRETLHHMTEGGDVD
ncbi:MAG: hypothetical protein LIO58_01015 [Oscillospiraceae bacterium]|nr:hypothetical protein [Oscillospiraceae bacterium]